LNDRLIGTKLILVLAETPVSSDAVHWSRPDWRFIEKDPEGEMVDQDVVLLDEEKSIDT
jgi:hypothetical protein